LTALGSDNPDEYNFAAELFLTSDRHIETEKERGMQAGRQTDRQTDRQTEAEKETDRGHKDKQAGKQTNKLIQYLMLTYPLILEWLL
jgi:hypothetical protein